MPEHITTPIPQAPEPGPAGQLAPFTLQRLDPFRRLWRAQDSQPGQARRVLAEYSLAGALRWAVPDGDTNPSSGAAVYPLDFVGLEEAWREVGRFEGRLTAGCMLEAHLMYCPAGLVQRRVDLAYESAGAWAELRVGVTWSGGGQTTGPHYWVASMEGAEAGLWGGGFENTAEGSDWHDLREKLIEAIRPPGAEDDLELAAALSEWPDVTITLEVRGGERIVHAVVYEVPDRHVQRHDDGAQKTVHGAPSSDVPFPVSPREDAPDVGIYENHRYGTVRTLQAAARQSERLGPHLVAWSHTEHDRTPTSDRGRVVPAHAEFVDVFRPSMPGGVELIGWDAGRPGWVIAGSAAQLRRLHGVQARGRLAVVPVTAWIDAMWLDDETGTGATVRLQSGPYEWLDARFEAHGVRETVRVYGYLESQVHGDHAAANMVALCQGDGLELRLFGVSVAFGHW